MEPAPLIELPADSPDITLHEAVLEQLMRVCDDEAAAWEAAAAPTLQTLRAVVGRLLTARPIALGYGTPLMSLSGYGPLVEQWRDTCAVASDSLWSQLEFYRTCGWAQANPSPLVELLDARERAEQAVA